MRKKVLLLMIIVPGIMMNYQQVQAQTYKTDDVKGLWLNEEKDAIVEIFRNGDKYFGKIVWLKEPNEENGKPKVDDKNPEVSFQNRPVMGLELLKNFVYYGADKWEDGTIYDPNNGKTYKCIITIKNPDLLYIRGYIGRAWMGLGRTTEWARTKL
ncbi:MAG: DUF2147 domain-containing protein [Bacteroidetes bacterium]|nr:DUF2147 domain-containing protein [Bacteroidota bacterium]